MFVKRVAEYTITMSEVETKGLTEALAAVVSEDGANINQEAVINYFNNVLRRAIRGD